MCTFHLVQSSQSLDFCTYAFQTGEPQGALNPDSPCRATLCHSRPWDWLRRCCPSALHLHGRSREETVPAGVCFSPLLPCSLEYDIGVGLPGTSTPITSLFSFLISLARFISCNSSNCSQGSRMEPICQGHAWRWKKSGCPVLCCHKAISYHWVTSHKHHEWSLATLVWNV